VRRYDRPAMSRYVARVLAPLAIAAVAVGVYLIVHDNLATHTPTSIHVTDPGRRRHHHVPRHTATHAKSTYYTVRSGDTLSAISHRTGVSLTRLEALNPSVKPPFDLQSGERLRLRR
jgi:LysM repeat protein